ncbi:MAG: ribosomal protein S27E [Salinirussus sp.]|jgi:ribosomal protein S27E
MSVEDNTTSGPVSSTANPDVVYTPSANYMPCEYCGEGTLVYDPDLQASRCRACGEAALPEVTTR